MIYQPPFIFHEDEFGEGINKFDYHRPRIFTSGSAMTNTVGRNDVVYTAFGFNYLENITRDESAVFS